MKAMILCAGYGTRLGSITKEIPKPMLDINGRPLLEYIISHLRKQGFIEIAINLHFKPEIIAEYFGDGSKFGVQIIYSHEPVLMGTAGAVKKMESFFKEEAGFLVHYGDVLTDQDFSSMIKSHHNSQAQATLLLHQRIKSNSVISLDSEQTITAFLERPSDEERKTVVSSWVNSGICFCSSKILDYIPANTPCDLPKDIFVRNLNQLQLKGFPLSGYRCAIDSPQRLEDARIAVIQGECAISTNNCFNNLTKE